MQHYFFSMNNFKRIIRVVALIFIITLAAAAAGIGGALIPVQRKKEDDNEIKIELVEPRKSDGDLEDVDDVQQKQ